MELMDMAGWLVGIGDSILDWLEGLIHLIEIGSEA